MSNTTTALLVTNRDAINSLVNKELKVNVREMLTASAGVSKNVWKYAIAVHNIVSGDMFKDDFKSLDGFAKAMDTNKSVLSKYDNAVDCIQNKLGEYGYDMTNLTYGKAYVLSTLGEDLTGFMSKYSNVKFNMMAQSQIEELVKKFKKAKDDSIDNKAEDETETEEVEVEVETKVNEITAIIEDGLMKFTYRKKDYIIPVKELKQYIVQETKA